jgi:hypothetical protein
VISSEHSRNYFFSCYIKMQYVEKQPEGLDDDIDLRALENGFVSSLSLSLSLSFMCISLLLAKCLVHFITCRYLSLL